MIDTLAQQTAQKRRTLPQINPVYFVLAALIVAITLQNPAFVEPTGYMNFLKRAAPLAILAAGQLYVIVSGGFDLSVGALITQVALGSLLSSMDEPTNTSEMSATTERSKPPETMT